MKTLWTFLIVAASVGSAADAPRRIISTSPGITEILFGLGLGDRVKGVTNYCKYPPEVTKLPKVGTWVTPNMEVILSLKPDLIVVQRTNVHDAARFQTVKLKTLEVHLDVVADIEGTIDVIGNAAGVPERARALNAKIRKGLAEIQSKVAAASRTRVLFVVGRNPGTLDGMIAVGPKSYLDEVVAIAGGRNILSDAKVPYVKVLHEEIVARNPQVIVDIGEHADAASITPEQARREVALWSRYPTLAAVRDKRIHIVASELFVVPGPRVLECAQRLAALLHPELFR
ncbi:MAG: helical backbone metal receptor [Bryobacteraceae bacterium]|nr:helical backbone metal receptor [Bryobacteraceae bacterium]